MKSIFALTFIAGFVAAEVPSHSYLPPPPRGYSSGPAVVAARALETHRPGDHSGHVINGFTRSSPASHEPGHSTARYNDEQSQPGYDHNAAGYPRNGLEDVNATVTYDAEELKPVSYQDSEDIARSTPGYDANANNFRSSVYRGNEQNGATSARPGYN